MITEEIVLRINELSRKKKKEGLTKEETEEQKQLYKAYLASIREQVTTQLDSAGVRKKDQKKNGGCNHHHHGPDCGCHKH